MLDHIVGAQRRSTPPSTLTEIIQDVRSRWRIKLALRGVVRSVGVAVALFFVHRSFYGMRIEVQEQAAGAGRSVAVKA